MSRPLTSDSSVHQGVSGPIQHLCWIDRLRLGAIFIDLTKFTSTTTTTTTPHVQPHTALKIFIQRCSVDRRGTCVHKTAISREMHSAAISTAHRTIVNCPFLECKVSREVQKNNIRISKLFVRSEETTAIVAYRREWR